MSTMNSITDYQAVGLAEGFEEGTEEQGSGIGLAIAQCFSEQGDKVTVSGRDTARLKASGFDFVEMVVTHQGIEATEQIIQQVHHLDGFQGTTELGKATNIGK